MKATNHFKKVFLLIIIVVGMLSEADTQLDILASPVESGVYTENFNTNTAKYSVEQAEWDIWLQRLRLERRDDIPQGAEYVGNQGVAVVALPDGNALAFWMDLRNGNYDIYAQKIDENGNRLWQSDLRINSDIGAGKQSSPAAAVDGNGNVFIAWEDTRNGESDIYVQKIDKMGTRLWPSDVLVHQDSLDGSPDIAVTTDGSAVITWDGFDIYAQKVGGGGNLIWTANIKVNDTTSKSEEEPSVGVDSTGNAVIAWNDWRNGSYSDVYAQRLGSDGSKSWSSDLRVNSDSGTGGQGDPDVVMDQSGNAIIVWQDGRNNFGQIYSQKINAAGSKFWTGDKLIGNTVEGQQDPTSSMDKNGNIFVVWEDYRDPGGYYAQKIDGNGNLLWSTDMCITQAHANGPTSIAPDIYGNLFVVIGDWDILAQKIDTDGSVQWPRDVRVNIDSGKVDQLYSTGVIDAEGNSVIVWLDNRGEKYSYQKLYAQKYDKNGSRLWPADIFLALSNWESPDAAVDQDGNIFVVWDFGGINAIKLDENGNKLWENNEVSIGTYNGYYYVEDPVVGVDWFGNAIIAWEDGRNDNWDIYAQKLDKNGNRLWINDIRINTDASKKGQDNPDIVVEENGNAFLAWTDDGYDPPDFPYQESHIFSQRIDQNGVKLWESDIQVSDADFNSQVYPSVAVNKNGEYLIVWEEGHIYEIFSQKLNGSGTKLWENEKSIGSYTSYKIRPKVSAIGMEDFLVVWKDSRNYRYDLYAQRLNSQGNNSWINDLHIDSDSGGYIDAFSNTNILTNANGESLVVWDDTRNGDSDIFAQFINQVGNKAWLSDLQVVIPDLFYYSSGTAQSRTVDTIASPIQQAILTAEFQANGGSVQFFLSNNGGADWFPVTPGVVQVFPTTGSDLRWKAELTAEPLWSRTPIISSLRIEYSSEVNYTDAYEIDDACSLARPIDVGGAAQAHSFHQYADQDWVWFNITAGTTYIIQTSNTQANADTTLELRPSCPQPPAATDDNVFGQEARITWQATYTGAAYVKVAQHDPAVYGTDTGYDLSVRIATSPPVAIIVAGHNDVYELQANITYMADTAYLTFLNAGVPKSNLRYYGPDANRDVDGNGLNDDILSPASPASVRDAIQDWARSRGVALGVPFFLYLADHGGVDQFLANGDASKISATDLNLWLSNLEATSGADNINVIFEACKSGSFIDINELGPAEISGHNRVVIASTSSLLNAFPSQNGAYFSDIFWTALGQSKDLKTAFELAKQAVQDTGLNQVPWLDDNGDALADALDGSLAQARGLGAAFGSRPPAIDWAQAGSITNGQALLTAQVRDDFGVAGVHVDIFPPDFVEPPPAPDGTIPELDIPRLSLSSAGGELFQVSYSGFTQAGFYRLVFYAIDTDGYQAMPVTLYVISGKPVFLPLVRR